MDEKLRKEEEMNRKGQRINVERQDDVVTALYDFAYALETREHDITSNMFDGRVITVNRKSIEETLDTIMSTFGYKVASIQ